jgi:hypothetical protein
MWIGFDCFVRSKPGGIIGVSLEKLLEMRNAVESELSIDDDGGISCSFESQPQKNTTNQKPGRSQLQVAIIQVTFKTAVVKNAVGNTNTISRQPSTSKFFKKKKKNNNLHHLLHWLFASCAVINFGYFRVKSKRISFFLFSMFSFCSNSNNIVALVALVQKSDVHAIRSSLKQSLSLKRDDPESI